MRWLSVLLLLFPSTLVGEGYRADSIGVTETVKQFVKDHRISGSDIEIVHRIMEVTHDDSLFIRIDREGIKKWIRNPARLNDYREELESKKRRLKELNGRWLGRILTKLEHQERKTLLEEVFFAEHNVQVYDNLLRYKNMVAQDLAFVVSGSEAIEHRIRDGCTTMAHLFIALAKAAGLEDVRFVVGANVSEIKKACPQRGKPRLKDVEIDGHMMALVKIDGGWALVNCTGFEPYSTDHDIRYEIFYELDDEAVSPEMLRGRVVRLPRYQREDFPWSELLIVGVGADKDDDLDVENHRALMNFSVSGDRDCPVCTWEIIDEK